MTLRVDLQIISDWIPDNAHVLDLGCGNGSLLKHLQQRNVTGYGLEIDNSKFSECIVGGVNVIQADLMKVSVSSVIRALILSFCHKPFRQLSVLTFCSEKSCGLANRELLVFLISAIGNAVSNWGYGAKCRYPKTCQMPGLIHPISIYVL